MSAIRGNKSELAKADKELAALIKTRMFVDGLSADTMAHRLGMSRDTFDRRMKRPRTFNLAELRKLAGVLSLSYEVMGEVLFR